MFNKSYSLKWDIPPQMAFLLTSQHPLEKAHVVPSSSGPFTNNTQVCGAQKHEILELCLDIYIFPEKNN